MAFSIQVENQTFQANRVFCIGRNYHKHVKELGNTIPDEPVVFMKPASCLVEPEKLLRHPPYGQNLQHEAEVVVLIGQRAEHIMEARARDCIAGLSLGLDLTLRDIQKNLKEKGLPWEKAKCFEQSAPLGNFTMLNDSINLDSISFECRVGPTLRQEGNTRHLIFPIPALIRFLSKHWILVPGDLIFTGTPEGVGPLLPGDEIILGSPQLGKFSWTMVG